MQTSAVPRSLALLHEIRSVVGAIDTPGLNDEEILSFLESDAKLERAIDEAHLRHQHMANEYPELYLGSSETELITELQEGFVNFYNPATVNPYVALSARGPWIITSHGAVVHDNGGYGMLERPRSRQRDRIDVRQLGDGERDDGLVFQKRLDERLRKELGHTRGWCPFENSFA